MKTSAKIAAACTSAAISLACIAGCTGDPDASSSSSAASSASNAASSSAVASGQSGAAVEGTPLFEFLAESDPGLASFDATFDTSSINDINYERDEHESIIVSDEPYIKDLYDALSQVVVTGEYQGDEYVTDSGTRFFIDMKEGVSHTVYFDFGKLVVGDKYYDVSNTKQLDSVLFDIESHYDVSKNDA